MIYYDREFLKDYRVITKEVFDSLPSSASLVEALCHFLKKYNEKADFYIEEIQKHFVNTNIKFSKELNLFYILMTLRVRYKNFFPAPSLCVFLASTLYNQVKTSSISNVYLNNIELLPLLLLLESKIEEVHFKNIDDSLIQVIKKYLEKSDSIKWSFEDTEIIKENHIALAQYMQNSADKEIFEIMKNFHTSLIYTSWNFLSNEEYQSIRKDLLSENRIDSVFQLAQPTREGNKDYPALLILNNLNSNNIKLIDLHQLSNISQYQINKLIREQDENVYLELSNSELLSEVSQRLAPSYYIAQNKTPINKDYRPLSDYAEVLRCQDVRVNVTAECKSQEDFEKYGENLFREVTLKDIDNLTGFYLSDDADFVRVDNFSAKFAQFILQDFDIVLAFKGSKATIGTVGIFKSSVNEENEEILKLSQINGYHDNSSFKLPVIPGNSFVIIRAKNIDPLYLFNYLQQADIQELIKSKASGTSVLSINTKAIKTLPIVDALLDEVENIKEQYSSFERILKEIISRKRLIKMRKTIPIYSVKNTLEMTREERLANITCMNKAYRRGDFEKESKCSKKIPIAPGIAKITKTVYGATHLQEMMADGYDFSLVIEKYGEEWLYNDEL